MPALLEKALHSDQTQPDETHDGQFKVAGIPCSAGISGGLRGNNSAPEHRSCRFNKRRSAVGNPGGLDDFRCRLCPFVGRGGRHGFVQGRSGSHCWVPASARRARLGNRNRIEAIVERQARVSSCKAGTTARDGSPLCKRGGAARWKPRDPFFRHAHGCRNPVRTAPQCECGKHGYAFRYQRKLSLKIRRGSEVPPPDALSSRISLGGLMDEGVHPPLARRTQAVGNEDAFLFPLTHERSQTPSRTRNFSARGREWRLVSTSKPFLRIFCRRRQ